ncbi:MAG: hypothetical protein AAFV86_06450 [Pseudomonadota bacterium]
MLRIILVDAAIAVAVAAIYLSFSGQAVAGTVWHEAPSATADIEQLATFAAGIALVYGGLWLAIANR